MKNPKTRFVFRVLDCLLRIWDDTEIFRGRIKLIYVRLRYSFTHASLSSLLLIALVLWFSSLIVSLLFIPPEIRINTPGTIFGVSLGLLTVIGFAITIYRLQEARLITRIITVEHLLISISSLLRESIENFQNIYFICYTPLILKVSYPNIYKKTLGQIFEKSPIKNLSNLHLICKGTEQLKTFYNSYRSAYPKLYGEKTVSDAIKETETFIKSLEDAGAKVKRINRDHLPHYHILFTNERGIIFYFLEDTPYYFDIEWRDDNQKEQLVRALGNDDQQANNIIGREQAERLDLVGNETKEPNLIHRFKNLYDFFSEYLDYPNNR